MEENCFPLFQKSRAKSALSSSKQASRARRLRQCQRLRDTLTGMAQTGTPCSLPSEAEWSATSLGSSRQFTSGVCDTFKFPRLFWRRLTRASEVKQELIPNGGKISSGLFTSREVCSSTLLF